MNLQELQKQIINKNLESFYIFTGEEIAIEKIYINKIAQVENLEIQYVEDIKSIYGSLHYQDMFNIPKLYVISQDIEFTKTDKIWMDLLVAPLNGNRVILKYDTIDKRGKFYKTFENQIVEFNRLSDEVLISYIKKDFPTMYDDNCRKLINMCNGNYNQILLELDKLRIYNNLYGDIDQGYSKVNTIFDDLDSKGAFHKEVSDITFEFIEKVLKRDISNTFMLQKQLNQIGESNIKLLSLLYTNFKVMLLLQSCQSSDICKTTGLQYYQVKYNEDKKGYYSIGELVNALRVIQKTEEGIKTGKIDEENSIDYVLCNIL